MILRTGGEYISVASCLLIRGDGSSPSHSYHLPFLLPPNLDSKGGQQLLDGEMEGCEPRLYSICIHLHNSNYGDVQYFDACSVKVNVIFCLCRVFS